MAALGYGNRNFGFGQAGGINRGNLGMNRITNTNFNSTGT